MTSEIPDAQSRKFFNPCIFRPIVPFRGESSCRSGPGALSQLRALGPNVICFFMSGGFTHYAEKCLIAPGARGPLMKPGLMRFLDRLFVDLHRQDQPPIHGECGVTAEAFSCGAIDLGNGD